MNRLKEKIQDLLVDIRYGANHLQDHIFECDDICGEYIQDILDDCVVLQELIDQQIKTILEAWEVVTNPYNLIKFGDGILEIWYDTQEEENILKKALEVKDNVD